jgi:Skp family chaperone for outer membrane proteins
MEDALIRLGTVSLKQNFEKEVFALNDELKENEKKIERIKNANVKDDFSAVYMDSLKLKRDTLVQNYQKQLADLTEQMNKALSEVAEKYDAPTIFNAKSTVVKTNQVVDVTDEVVNKIQK